MSCLGNTRLEEVKNRVIPSLERSLAQRGLALGDHIFLRAYKLDKELEVWVKPSGKKKFELFETYSIVGNSGVLGPKLAEGDRQMPEGFYEIKKNALNPNSRYHLSFNIGYPNAFDRSLKRTGSFIMVHGSNVSIGCYAMTDPVIEKIYLMVESALKNGQNTIPFHSYPFRYTRSWERKYKENQWFGFWKNLEQGHDYFKEHRVPARISYKSGHYVVAK